MAALSEVVEVVEVTHDPGTHKALLQRAWKFCDTYALGLEDSRFGRKILLKGYDLRVEFKDSWPYRAFLSRVSNPQDENEIDFIVRFATDGLSISVLKKLTRAVELYEMFEPARWGAT